MNRSNLKTYRSGHNFINRATARAVVTLAAMLALSLTGCRLGQPGSASFASVTINNHTPDEIQAAAVKAFQADGYMARNVGPGAGLFEREGTRANDIAYNGIVATQSGARTMVRVRTELRQLGENSYRLQCQAYMVRNAGDSFFEEETRVTNIRSGQYQKVLDNVADSLK